MGIPMPITVLIYKDTEVSDAFTDGEICSPFRNLQASCLRFVDYPRLSNA